MQDQFSVVMGHEFEMYEITALMLVRNDARAERFCANVQELERRARALPAVPHWCKTAGDLVRAEGGWGACARCFCERLIDACAGCLSQRGA